MEIVIRTGRTNKFVKKAQTYMKVVTEQVYSEVENNPNLIGTVYLQEEDITREVYRRVEDLLRMEAEADKMSGGYWGGLRYKLYRSTSRKV